MRESQGDARPAWSKRIQPAVPALDMVPGGISQQLWPCVEMPHAPLSADWLYRGKRLACVGAVSPLFDVRRALGWEVGSGGGRERGEEQKGKIRKEEGGYF